MELITLTKYGDPQKVEVRRSTQAKNIIIRITHKGAELVLPLKVKAKRVIIFYSSFGGYKTSIFQMEKL